MDAEPTKAEKICLLVKMLHAELDGVSGEPLDWDTIEELVADYPGWAAYVGNLRYPRQNLFNRRMIQTNILVFPEFPSLANCADLFLVFEPYAILLNPALDKSQKVERVEACMDYSDDHDSFWEAALNNSDEEIQTIVAELIEWMDAHRSLLRGAVTPPPNADELLRAAKPMEIAPENLLRGGEMPAESPPKPAGFWARLMRRNTQ